MIQLCLLQLLDYKAQTHIKHKKVLKCEKCPLKESCAKWVKEQNEKAKKV